MIHALKHSRRPFVLPLILALSCGFLMPERGQGNEDMGQGFFKSLGVSRDGDGRKWDDPLDLDHAIDHMVETLVEQGKLEGKSIIVDAVDFYDAGTNTNLPLGRLISDQAATSFRERGVRISLAAIGEGSADYKLIGTWTPLGKLLKLQFKVIYFGEEDQMAAAASQKIARDQLDEKYLKPDMASMGQYLVRMLSKRMDSSTRMMQRSTVTLHPFKISWRPELTELGRYLVNQVRPSFAKSQAFQPLDPPKAQEGETSEKPTIKAETELLGDVYENGDDLQIDTHLNDDKGLQIAAATIRVPKELIPKSLFKPPRRIRSRKSAPGLPPSGAPGETQPLSEEEQLEQVKAFLEGHPSSTLMFAHAQAYLERSATGAAMLLFRRAADQGNGDAARSLGQIYDPRDLSKDRKRQYKKKKPYQSYRWYKKALNIGNANAQQDLDNLKEWAVQAAANGDRGARKILKKMR